MKMKKAGAVLFDLDDTIIDHTYAVIKALSAVQLEFNFFRGLELPELRQRWGASFWTYWPRVIKGEITLLESRYMRFKEMVEQSGVVMEDSELHEMAVLFGDKYLDGVKLIDGVEEVLKLIRHDGIITGVVTNTTEDMLREKMRRCSVSSYIDFSINAEEAGMLKPEPGIFNAAARKTGRRPEETVFVGDSITSDIMGSWKAGMMPVWINRFGRAWNDRGLKVPILTGYVPAEQSYHTIISAPEYVSGERQETA